MSATMRPPPIRYESNTQRIDPIALQRALDEMTSHAIDETAAEQVYAAVTCCSTAPPPALQDGLGHEEAAE